MRQTLACRRGRSCDRVRREASNAEHHKMPRTPPRNKQRNGCACLRAQSMPVSTMAGPACQGWQGCEATRATKRERGGACLVSWRRGLVPQRVCGVWPGVLLANNGTHSAGASRRRQSRCRRRARSTSLRQRASTARRRILGGSGCKYKGHNARQEQTREDQEGSPRERRGFNGEGARAAH